MRGFAVLAVVFLHTGLFPWGWAGVDVFFVLSGFLITGILLDAKESGATGWSSYAKPFYIRRALRILPIAYVALAVVFLLLPSLRIWPRPPLKEQSWYWTYLSNWFTGPRSPTAWRMSHYWSLAVEEQYYLCWPWIVLACNRRNLQRITVALLMLAPLLRLYLLSTGADVEHDHAYVNFTPLRMDGLAAGSLLAITIRETGIERLREAAWWMLMLGVLAFVVVESNSPNQSGYVFGFSALAAAGTGALILALGDRSMAVSRILNAGWVRWVGTVSYGVYIIHYPVSLWLNDLQVTPAVEVAGTLFLTLTFASLSWYLFERPILSFKRYWPMFTRAGSRMMTK